MSAWGAWYDLWFCSLSRKYSSSHTQSCLSFHMIIPACMPCCFNCSQSEQGLVHYCLSACSAHSPQGQPCVCTATPHLLHRGHPWVWVSQSFASSALSLGRKTPHGHAAVPTTSAVSLDEEALQVCTTALCQHFIFFKWGNPLCVYPSVCYGTLLFLLVLVPWGVPVDMPQHSANQPEKLDWLPPTIHIQKKCK